jgi:hypothetical protein
MSNNYGGIVWTNHALQRLHERNVAQSDAYYTFQHPDQSRRGSSPGTWVYYKTYGNQRIEVVAKQNDKKQWIIMSVWSKPVHGKDARPRKVGFWQTFLRQILGR